MRELQQALDARAEVRRAGRVVRRPFASAQATGDPELTTVLRADAMLLGRDLPDDHVLALLTAARVLAARPRLAFAWGLALTERTAPGSGS
jgi:hypothetical protein